LGKEAGVSKLVVGLARVLPLCAVLLVLPGVAEPGQGEVCYSSFMPATQANPLTNDTKFACSSLGEVTIPAIYQLGWRVSHLSLQAFVDANNPRNSQAAWMVLIEKL
jgi:hypothetical protein